TDVDQRARELAECHASGGRALVDSMPCDCGRNIKKLAEISRRSGVHIVAPTGLHLQKYYDLGHWGQFYSEDMLADLFVAEIEEGVDKYEYKGPIVGRTEYRAGVIKVASGLDKLSDYEKKLFTVAANTHRRTGAPILTHTEQGTAALEQIALFEEQDVDLSHVVLSHTDRFPELTYHREILSTGVNVEYDSGFRWQVWQGNPTRDLILALIEEFPTRIMLGMDAARKSYWKSYGGGPGLTWLLNDFTAELRERGLTEEQWEGIFVANPARAYQFAAKQAERL
ncbi:MAG: aryldialkylphosphatase, partial [Verrucomicrobiota bacterium]